MIWEAFVDFVFPKMCVGCNKLGNFLCRECHELMDFVDQVCPMCGEFSVMGWTHPRCKRKHGMDGLIAIYEYQEPVARAVVDSVKYGFNKEVLEIVLKDFVFEFGLKFDFLVPVPLYFYRENWRGFNQAEVFAKIVEAKSGIKTERLLMRKRNTLQQVKMKTREDREANVREAFEIASGKVEILSGKKILLVDDVFTSGADMRECTKVLKIAGADVVWGLSLAH